jgi:hypothetical protein
MACKTATRDETATQQTKPPIINKRSRPEQKVVRFSLESIGKLNENAGMMEHFNACPHL